MPLFPVRAWLLRSVLALLAGAFGATVPAAAQSGDWSGILTISPTPSPYLADWERVPSTALLALTYSGTATTDFRVRVTLTHASRGLIGTTESPTVTVAGGPSAYLYSVRDAVFEWTTVSRNQAVTDAAMRTGQLPEGEYRACARVLTGVAGTLATEACADFSILQPDPPQLLAPQDGDVVVSTLPFLQWTPVLAPATVPLSYEVTVVELLDRQQPRAALEANQPVLRQVSSTPFLLYPLDALPLERTKRYAWQVRAVDDAGRQLFRDGAASEIWSFEMSDELLRPVGRVGDLPDSLVLLPGVAQLTGLRAARITRTETEVTIDGQLNLQFLGAAGAKEQRVDVRGLRAGFRGDALTLLAGRVDAEVPEAFIPASLRGLVTFDPLVFTPATGFRASATLRLPGAPAVPLAGAVQLTSAGLFGRLERTGQQATPIRVIGRAPVQYEATGARVTLPDGRIEMNGRVLLFEQDVGCPAAGPVENGIARLPVFCDPARGFRPDTSSTRSLLTFGTVAGSIAADFLTDTLGSELRAPATFSVFGEADRACTLQFTMIFLRDGIKREDEQQSCESSDAIVDFGWVRMALSNLRIERLEYAPGATLVWRALVDLDPEVRGARDLNLPTIKDVRLDEAGVSLPSTSSDEPGTSTSGYVEIQGFGVLPRTIGFRGGLISYARWLRGDDPGFEWGSGTSWVRLPGIGPSSSGCLNSMPLEVDTLILARGRLEAPLKETRFTGDGCKLYAAENLHVMVTSIGGAVRFAIDSVVSITELPAITGDAIDHRADCGVPLIGCFGGASREALKGDIRLTPTGRLRGTATAFSAGWANFDLRFAKLQLAGGRFTLGVDTSGAQTALYDGSVRVDFGKIDESKAADTTTKRDTTATGAAGAAVAGAGSGLLSSAGDTVRAQAQLDWVRSRLVGGRIALRGPFKLEVGFVTFVISEAALDTLGLHVDGRQRTVVSHTTATAKETSTGGRPDSTYTTKNDTLGVTFAGVRLDPSTGDISAGTVSFDGQLALESSPLASAVTVGGAAISGAIQGGGEGALAAVGTATSGTNIFGFKLVNAAGSFDPAAGLIGNIRLQLPTTPTMDAQGMRISGRAPAMAALAGSRYDSASVSFENGFAMRPAAGRVTAGRALLSVRQYPIAYLEPAGWRLAIAELVQTVIPDTLFLPARTAAFVVLRDASRQLLVDVSETEEGPRIRTRAGTPVRIVIPALQGTRQSAPQATVAMDLTLERGSWRPLVGEIVASAAGLTTDDFANPDIPIQVDSVIFRAVRGAEPSFLAHGRFNAWPAEQEPMRLSIGIRGDGELRASVEQAFSDNLPLVGGSELVQFRLDSLRFSAQGRLGSDFQWRLEMPGRLAYFDAEAQRTSQLARATFRLSPQEAALVDFQAFDSLTTVRLPGVDLRLGRVRAPVFRWDFASRRFDFELLFDVGLLVPALDSLRLPEIRDIRITPQGIAIPAFEMGSTPVAYDASNPFAPSIVGVRVGGFGVKALAFRVSEFRWNWFAGAPPPQFNFGVDLEFSVEDLPSGVEGQAARIALRALNVGVTNGVFTGRFEPIEIPVPIRTPVADIRGAFGDFRVGEGVETQVSIGVIADLRLPDLLACSDPALRYLPMLPGADTLFLSSNGTIRGTVRNVLPRCPMNLGPFDLSFGQSTVTFGFDPVRSRVDVGLDMAATLRVPGATPGETVSATGRLVLDVDEGRVLDASIAIDQPFFWAPDTANPFLKLVVSQASLTTSELRFGATGQLRTQEGAGVDVAFENVAFDLNTLALKSGRIRLTADAAVGIEIPDDGSLLFGVYPVSTPRGGTASARLVLPTGALIDSAGLHISGTATASLAFGGTEYAALAGEFANDFTIATTGRVAIARGRINLRDTGGQLIAYADSLGFWPGNVFAVLPIPARLGIPSVDVAYIQLRDPADTSQLLIETEFGAETVRLRTRAGQRVTVSLPALANGGPVPTLQAEFDLVLNSRNMRPLSGGMQVAAAPGQSLVPLQGMPIRITQLGFAADTGGFRLRAGAVADLPGPLASTTLAFRNIEVSSQGLTGVIELGRYTEIYDPGLTPIAQADLLGDTLSIAFTGAELTLEPNANVLRLSGGIRSSLFKLPNGSPRVIHLAARIDTAGFRGTADVSDAEIPIPIGVAQLTLENGAGKPALAVTASAQEFAVVLGGSIRLPTIAPGFALGVEDFKVGTAGIAIPNVSVTAPANTKEFDLFGARFALRDSTVGATQVAPAIGIQMVNGHIRFTLSGYVTMMQNTTRFIGLRFGTDGTFSLQGADFLSRPIDLIANTARLTRASIVNNALELRGDVRLPAPFTQQAPQELTLRIAADGTVTGGGRIVVISEAEGLATARTKLSVGVAAFHLRHVDLAIDFSDAANTAVSAVADIYIQEKQANLLRFGSVQGGTVTPGLRISAAGAVTWGGLAMPGPITLDMEPVRLVLRRATSSATPTGFAVDISGDLGLNLAGTGGSLAFEHVGFTSEGELRLGSARFNGGTFTIQDQVRIVVGRLAWSSTDTSIYVPIARPPGANGEIQRDSALTLVSSFVDLGARVDIAGVFSGGVDRVLVYVKSADATNHFLVQNLQVVIPGTIEFTASLSYDETPGGFDMALSTEGLLLSAYRIGLVGVMGKEAGVFRAGVFLRTSLTVPIIPGIVTLTEVGGGLFVNPRASDLMLVKNVAGMNGPASDRIGMPPAGRFAVMLYAGFEVAGTNGVSAAAGRALVTITDQAFQINAMATFFRMNDQISGDLALQVGWTPAAYVRGMIALVIDIDQTVTGTASVEFFAGSNVFAVKGSVDLMVLGTIQSYASVIIVPSGFTANLGFRIQRTAGPVGLDVGANLRIWYRPSTNDLGAYLRLYGDVTALGITGRIELIGALVIQPELAIYAQGSASVVGIDVLKVEVWVQYTSAGFAAGLGRNEELAAVLARAEEIAADLEREANAILAGIDAAARARATTPLVVSDASLNAAYDNFQRWTAGERLLFWGGFVFGEGTLGAGLVPLSASDPYAEFYARVLNDRTAGADTALVRQLRTEAQGKLQVIADRRADVEARIRALRLELDAAETAAAFVPPLDPVIDSASGSPALVPGPVGPDGRATMIVANPPRFELDDQRAAAARTAMTSAASTSAAAAPALRAQLASVEAGLATVMAATAASDPSSFASYARVHSDAVETIEHQFAADVDFRMRRRSWVQGKLDTLAAERAGVVQRLNDRIDAMVALEQGNTAVTEPTRRYQMILHIDSIARHRATLLTGWSGDPSILSNYQSAAASHFATVNSLRTQLRNDPGNGAASANLDLEVTWFRTQAVEMGIQSWWGVANVGLTTAANGAVGLVASADAAARPVVRGMRDMHANITSQLASLNERQRELVGVLHDLYDGYLRTYGTADSVGQRYAARRAQLVELLAAPRIGTSQVVVTDFGFLSSVQSTWTGTHARGVYEYLLQEGADSLMTVGAQGNVRRWQYTTELAGASVPMNQRLVVRGGAGFTAQSLTSYTVTFRRGSAGSPVSQVATPPVDVTSPSAPVITFPGLITRASATGPIETWTGDGTRLTVSWSANDLESGIAEYSYRVVSYEAVSGTQTLSLGGSFALTRPRTPTVTEYLPWTSAGGRTSVTILGLTLPADRPITVEVKARNGAGIQGPAGASPTLRHDVTAPVFAAGTTFGPPPPPAGVPTLGVRTGSLLLSGGRVSGLPSGIGGFSPPLSPVCGVVGLRGMTPAKVWDGRLVTVTPDNGVVGVTAPPTLTFNFPLASDPETGVYAYGYRVDTIAPTAALSNTGWHDLPEYAPTFVARGPNMVYGRPMWISFAAWNGGGARSAPLTYGPVTIPDPSGPSAPAFCGDYTMTGFIAYLESVSTDAESGVLGYQMRVRNSSGTILRDFPAGSAVDWPASQALAGRGIRIPVGIAAGGDHRVELRAINGLGMAGDVTVSGEILVDVTQPPQPGVSANLDQTGRAVLTLQVANDPESGISGVDIAFGTGPDDITNPRGSSRVLLPYTSYNAVTGSNRIQVSLPQSVLAEPQIWVYVRARNGVGMSSVSTRMRVQ
ncbi:MAG: hypothetical protein JNL44_02165 [Gemmatimonadetes bacterium]|nr:hypothetical protein [Gemmatimonadota bacterium]